MIKMPIFNWLKKLDATEFDDDPESDILFEWLGGVGKAKIMWSSEVSVP